MVHHDHSLWEEKLPDVEYFTNNIQNNITDEVPITLFCQINADRSWIITQSKKYNELIENVNKNLEKCK